MKDRRTERRVAGEYALVGARFASMRQLVRKIDHVYAVLEDASAAHQFMVERVGLPTAWPFSSYGAFASGGVGLGNINLEFISAGPGWDAQRPARLTAIALEPGIPADESFLVELDRRGIEHSPLMPTAGWTNVGLVNGAFGASVFVCDYHLADVKDERGRTAALEACGGGALGVRSAAELLIGTPALTESQEAWRRLFDPVEPKSPHCWRIGTGPSLRLVSHERFEILDLVLAVEDPDTAVEHWAELVTDAAPLGGLPLSFARA